LKYMNKSYINYIIACFTTGALVLIAAFILPYFLLEGDLGNRELVLTFFGESLIALSLIPVFSAAYFAFDKVDRGIHNSFYILSRSVLIVFLVFFTITVIANLYINDFLIIRYFTRFDRHNEAVYNKKTAKATSVEPFRLIWERTCNIDILPVGKKKAEVNNLYHLLQDYAAVDKQTLKNNYTAFTNAPAAGSRRQKHTDRLIAAACDLVVDKCSNILKEYPFRVQPAILIDEIYRFTQARQQEKNTTKKKYRHLLKNKAAEYKTSGEYAAAAYIYEKLINHYPDTRAYRKEIDHFKHELYYCRQLERDPEMSLSPEKRSNFILNKKLAAVRELMADGNIRRAYNMIRDIYIAYPEEREVEATYTHIVTTLKNNEFLLSTYKNLKKYAPRLITYSNLKFYYNDNLIRAERITVYKKTLFLENVRLTMAGKTSSFRYAKYRRNRLYLKNTTNEISKVIGSSYGANLADMVHLLAPANKKFLYFLSFPALLKLQQTAVSSFFYRPFFYDFIINCKINILIYIVTLFFILLALSWLNRKYLKHILSFLFLLVFSILMPLLLFVCAYIFAFTGELCGFPFYLRAAFTGLNILLLILTVYRVSKIKLT